MVYLLIFNILQLSPYFNLPREIHLLPIFIVFGYYLLNNPINKLRYILLSLFFVIVSIILSEDFFDFIFIVLKFIVCMMVFIVFYNSVNSLKNLTRCISLIVLFMILEAILRAKCMMPTSLILLNGPLSYKTECSPFFFDSNTSGNILTLLFALIIYIRNHINKPYFYLLFVLIPLLSLLTASKASFITSLVLIGLMFFENRVKNQSLRLLIVFIILVTIGSYVVSQLSFDPSFQTKVQFFSEFLYIMTNEPYNFLFGHGYYSGAKVLAGTSEFAHLNIALIIGMSGIFGAVIYYYFIFKVLYFKSESLLIISSFLLLSISYFPPFFDYYFILFALCKRAIEFKTYKRMLN